MPLELTLAELRDEVRENIHRDDSFPDRRINRALNWALERLGCTYPWKELKREYKAPTTADQAYYAWDPLFFYVYSLRLFSDTAKRLDGLSYNDFDEEYPNPEEVSNSTPSHYVDYGSHFRLFPTPDAEWTMRLRAQALPKELSSDSDTPDLRGKADLVVAIATGECFQKLREVEDARHYMERGRFLMDQYTDKAWRTPDLKPKGEGMSVGEELEDADDPFSSR